nr:MAG TPA: hypothetical protein [Caudoviricetes sp.]
MDYNEGLELINYAIKSIGNNKLFFRWAVNYEKIGMTYEEFKEKVITKVNSTNINSKLSAKKIFNDVKNMMKKYDG